MNVFERL
jgi:hypothetical protein